MYKACACSISANLNLEDVSRTTEEGPIFFRWQRLAQGLKYERICGNLCISIGTVHNILKLFEETGDIEPRKHPKQECKLDRHHSLYIIGLVMANPEMQLAEIRDKVEEISGTVVHVSTLCRLLAKHGFTRKKIQHVALQRRVDFRAEFIATASLFREDMFVWVDETGSKLKDMLRQYGYAIQGERATSHKLLVRGHTISTIAAICTEGVLAIDITASTVNGEHFYDFIRGYLIPQLLPFDGQNPRSVVVMDNCSIHHIQEVSELLNDTGIVLFYLPPYSPDLNPIELTFSYIKGYLKKHEDIMHIIPLQDILNAAFKSVTTVMCKAWIKHCGYS